MSDCVSSAGDAVLLAIESSCDETAAAVVTRDLQIRSSVVASQTNLHERFGGVVPEIASRAHVERILPVLESALDEADCRSDSIRAVAVTAHPGLVGSLLVGLTAAKTIAWLLDVPLITVNHVEGHLFACRMAHGPAVFPGVGLVVSGGHTNLYDCRSATDLRLLGSTIDDAVGEAFDKVAQLLGLPYPGGPAIERASRRGRSDAVQFPRPLLSEDRLQFSFSGLKTAVRYAARGTPGQSKPVPPLDEQRVADLAASFQQAAVDVLVGKTLQAAEQIGAKNVCVGGGVAANRVLQAALEEQSAARGLSCYFAPSQMCTDNAAMAAIAWEHFDAGQFAALDADVIPGLIRDSETRGGVSHLPRADRSGAELNGS